VRVNVMVGEIGRGFCAADEADNCRMRQLFAKF